MAVANEAVVKRAHYISEMSQNSDTYSTVQYCFTAIEMRRVAGLQDKTLYHSGQRLFMHQFYI
jgi:hypothetical protein